MIIAEAGKTLICKENKDKVSGGLGRRCDDAAATKTHANGASASKATNCPGSDQSAANTKSTIPMQIHENFHNVADMMLNGTAGMMTGAAPCWSAVPSASAFGFLFFQMDENILLICLPVVRLHVVPDCCSELISQQDKFEFLFVRY